MLFDFAVAQFKLLQDIAAARAVILSHIQATAGALDAAARPPVRHPHHRGTSIPDELEGGPGTGTQSGFGTFVPGEDDESFEDKLQDAVERALKEAIKNAKGGGFQEGGTLVARRPRLALFGERGPEIVRFSPLNRVGADEGRIFGDSIPVGPNGRQGRLELLIGLSKDLEHRIITEAVNETADIILERIS